MVDIVKDAQVVLHGVRHDAAGRMVDHLDVVLPWSARQALGRLANFDGTDCRSLDG